MSIASQLGVELERGSDGSRLYGPDGRPLAAPPKPLQFEEKAFEHFDVEYTVRGDDIVYHFWPPKDGDKFIPNFGKLLEEGFKKTLPSHADVRAKFTSLLDAQIHAKELDLCYDKQSRAQHKWIPRETYFVQVIDGAKYPLADTFLMHRVFLNIEKAIEEARG